jgi:hypothetical protein
METLTATIRSFRQLKDALADLFPRLPTTGIVQHGGYRYTSLPGSEACTLEVKGVRTTLYFRGGRRDPNSLLYLRTEADDPEETEWVLFSDDSLVTLQGTRPPYREFGWKQAQSNAAGASSGELLWAAFSQVRGDVHEPHILYCAEPPHRWQRQDECNEALLAREYADYPANLWGKREVAGQEIPWEIDFPSQVAAVLTLTRLPEFMQAFK